MLADVARFYRDARRAPGRRPNRAPRPSGRGWTEHGYGAAFREHFLIPITSAVWSTAADRVLEFPVGYLLRFLDNHGLIGYGNGPQWRVVVGGSRSYVERLVAGLPGGSVRTGRPGRLGRARSVRRPRFGPPTAAHRFDAVVMATHADDALRLLRDADERERRVLDAFEYSDEPGRAPHRRTDPRIEPRGPGLVERPDRPTADGRPTR